MEYWSISVLSIIINALIGYYLFKNFNFFKRHGIIHIPSIPILGVMTPIILRQMSFVDITRRIYNFNRYAKYIGLYATTEPVLMLRDPELIKAIIIKNSDKFINRPTFNNFNDYMITQSLFSLQNTEWRNIRNLLNFFFTSHKMKTTFNLMSKHAADFAETISTLPADKSYVNIKDVFDRYTNDVIALCIYGMKIDSVRDPTNKFYVCGKDITHMSAIRSIKIKNEIAIRNAEHVTRPDMIQLMLNNRGKEGQIQLNIDDIFAQAYTFYFAGFETSSSVMSFITYKIVTNPSVQVKLRQEIDELLDKLNGSVTYEAINQLKYLDAVIKEALRLFSPSVVERVCKEAYKLPPALPGEKPFTIYKGMIIWIPIYAIHHDDKYYDNPMEFRPERFLDNDHDPPFYFPFGLGPRICIGKRFGLLIVKVVLFHILAKCELELCVKSLPIKFSKKHLIMIPEDGYWLNIQRRNDKNPMKNVT
ncbi:cytochrome P450 9e2 [Mycetomoellerius zeteki]|uniref:cytochrome P450 9e2 n=1 Tax=Mycetomoellerius zeteki TaxID=64791 RepID=UPI00084E9726|nr:PREDICTED: cytochrome P450 9e2-like [Trachymyrmex zeteki]